MTLVLLNLVDNALKYGGDGPITVRLRLGLHTGEVVRDEDDFYGRNVAEAARTTAQTRARALRA